MELQYNIQLAHRILDANFEHTRKRETDAKCWKCRKPFEQFDKYNTLYETGGHPIHKGCLLELTEVAAARGKAEEEKTMNTLDTTFSADPRDLLAKEAEIQGLKQTVETMKKKLEAADGNLSHYMKVVDGWSRAADRDEKEIEFLKEQLRTQAKQLDQWAQLALKGL